MNEQALRELVLQCGAWNAAAVDANAVVTSAAFRDVCRTNACGNYNRCYTCPPDAGDIQVLMRRIREYSRAVLYQTEGDLEDAFDVEGMKAAAARHAQVGLRIECGIRALGERDFLHLSCGGYHLCETCAKRTGEPCRHPGVPLPSLESNGVDVYNTVKNTELKYTNGRNTVTFFGTVLWGRAECQP